MFSSFCHLSGADDSVFAQRLRARWVKPFLLIAFFCFFGRVILLIPPQPCPSITHFWVQSSLRSRWSPARDAEIFKAELCYTYRLKQPVSKNRPSFEEAVELFRELTRPENKRLDNERNSQPRTCFVLKNSSEM